MTPLQRYVAEEIATDHVDGLLTRREALRRLALLGIGATAASALITACGEAREAGQQGDGSAGSPASPAPSTTERAAPPGADTAVATEPITWPGPTGELQGAWAAPDIPPLGAVLVIHENKGLNDWVRSVAGRFAGIGYSALAIDLLSSRGGTATFTDPAQATAALTEIPPEESVANLKSGLDELARRTPGAKLAAVGFCLGGGMVWRLLDSGAPQLAAAVPFYGPIPDDPDFSGSAQAAVLGFYGANDARVNATKDAAAAALTRAGMVHELVVEEGADHAFFNDTGERYNPTAAADAWRRVGDWFAEHVA